jgi:hypothetical protein
MPTFPSFFVFERTFSVVATRCVVKERENNKKRKDQKNINIC